MQKKKPQSDPEDFSDLAEGTPEDLSSLSDSAPPAAPVEETLGAKAFSLAPFQGQRGVQTFGLPQREGFANFPEPIKGVLQAGSGAVKAGADTALGLFKLAPGTSDFREPIGKVQQQYLQPDPLARKSLLGYEAEKFAEWFYPMGAEAKVEKLGTKALGMIPGFTEALAAKGGKGWLAQSAATVPRAATQAGSGAVIAGAQGSDPAEAASIGGALGLAFGQAGILGKRWSAGLKENARKKFMQAMGVEGKEARARAEKVVDEMMANAPFFMTRRGMMKWAQNRIEEVGRQRAEAEAPIALTWGQTIGELKKRAQGEIGGRTNFPQVPGYNTPAPISTPWTKEAQANLDIILGFADKKPQLRPTITQLVQQGMDPEQIAAYLQDPAAKVGDLVYQAVRRGIQTNTGDFLAPYLDMIAFQTRAGDVISAAGGYTTKSKEVWANKELAPLRAVGKAIAESIEEGLPDIARFNDQLSTALNVVSILDPALKKNLPQEEGLKVLMGGSGHPAERILKLGMWHTLLTALRGVTNSTAWRTTGAAWQLGLSNALRRGDVEKAGRMIFALEAAPLDFSIQSPIKKVTTPQGEVYDEYTGVK